MGLQWECGGHENPMKPCEIGGMYFNLKGRSWLSLWPRLKEPWPGPTKLSLALGTEGSHRAAMPVTGGWS